MENGSKQKKAAGLAQLFDPLRYWTIRITSRVPTLM